MSRGMFIHGWRISVSQRAKVTGARVIVTEENSQPHANVARELNRFNIKHTIYTPYTVLDYTPTISFRLLFLCLHGKV